MVSSAVVVTYGLASWKNRREISKIKREATEKEKESEKKKKPYLVMSKTLTE